MGRVWSFQNKRETFFYHKNPLYLNLSKMCKVSKENLILKQGRQYQREISYDELEFSLPHKLGDGRHEGVVAWSRILSQDEVVMAMNSHIEKELKVDVVLDSGINREGEKFRSIYSSEESFERAVVNSFFYRKKTCDTGECTKARLCNIQQKLME
ncbi:hypothetical protein [uncultured Ilyobacter sp.]|uniref:hypothetical protein n=1 Tax=uncultured Ilyobacter sp. TaxID=544433 RepID=UPI0029F565F8|nr:hypothetical protein [uncultured Ilyobacter sp.]